jgi:hypothetical protein
MKHARGICDASGFEYPLRDLVKQWDGALVHPRFCDKRNPQDFVRGVRESVLPYTRPEAPDTFVAINEVQPGDL